MATQHQLIIEYCKQFGSIVPAKLYGEIYKGQMFGSELSKRARELRKKGTLVSWRAGKFEVFRLADQPQSTIIEEMRQILEQSRRAESVEETKQSSLF